MAMQKPELVRSFYADTAITANKVVKASTTNAGAVMLPAATTDLTALGVTVAASDTRQWVPVALAGIIQVTAGGTITVGALLGFDTSGQAVAITPSGSGTTLRGCIGTALNAAVSGGLVDVAFHPSYCQV
jgi:hypothetical protein